MADKTEDQEQSEEEQDNGNGDGIRDQIKAQLREAMSEATQEILAPAVKQAANQATQYAIKQGPGLAKSALPGVMKSVGMPGVGDPKDLPKAAMGKAGEMLSGAGGLKGVAGKIMAKIGGGKGGNKAAATGYGQGRRIMVQQHQYVPVNVKDAFRAWTESEWPEYMHRVNTLDRQIDEDEARYAIGIKGFWFKKNFTALIQEQRPFSHIVWSTTQGNIKNTGRISFFEVGEDLTLMILNLDMAPSGLREKWVRGARYHKRGIRSDFHRFSAWVQMRTPDQLLDMEGWLGTVEGGKITQTHEEYVEEHEEEQDRAEKAEEQAQDAMEDPYLPEGEEPEDEDEEPDEDEDEELDDDEEAEDEEDDDVEEDDEAEDEDDQEADDDEPDDEPEDDEPEDEDEEDEPEEEPEPPRARKRSTAKRSRSSGRSRSRSRSS
jgi:hypothetical protein